MVKESFAPNTYLRFWERGSRQQEGSRCIDVSHKWYSRQSIPTSRSAAEQWYLYLFRRKSIVDRSEIINAGFHNPDTLRQKKLTNDFLLDPRIPDKNQFTQDIWSHGDCPPMCGFEKCVTYDASLRWMRWWTLRKVWFQGCSVLNVSLTYGGL